MTDDPASDARAMARFQEAGDIQRVEEGGGVRYKRVMLLSPGLWADAGSKEYVDYNAEAIRNSAENWVDIDAVRQEAPDWPTLSNEERADRLNQLGERVAAESEIPVNFLHGPAMFGADSLDEIGTIPLDSIIVDDDGRMYGDLVLHGDSPQSETAIDLMDEVLEAATEPGADAPPVGPSVEIPADRVDQDGGTLSLQEAFFSAVGLVFNPASKPVELGQQARERAVAMAAADGDASGVVYRAASTGDGGTTKRTPRHRRDMDEFDPSDMNDEELARTLETMREDVDALERALADDESLAEVQRVVEEYLGEGGSPEDTADALIQWAQENTDADMGALESVAEEYLADADAEDLSETPVGELQSYLDSQAGGEGGEEGDGGEEGEDEVTMSDLDEVKGTVGQVAEALGDIKDMLSAREDEREETLSELERRLSEIEDEDVKRSLTGEQPGEFVPDDGDSSGSADKRHEDVMM